MRAMAIQFCRYVHHSQQIDNHYSFPGYDTVVFLIRRKRINVRNSSIQSVTFSPGRGSPASSVNAR